MKNFVFAVLLATTSLYCHAIDGHNGIKFSMTQQQLEGMGFICNPNTKSERSSFATCKHMDMTGAAFSVPTRNYEVEIGSDKRVSSIRADLVGIRSTADYLALLTNISGFFPKKDEANTHSHQGSYMKEAWRANNNAGISVFYSSGVKGLIKDTLWVSFHSPSLMAMADKKRAEEAAKKSREPKEKSSPENIEGQERSPEQK